MANQTIASKNTNISAFLISSSNKQSGCSICQFSDYCETSRGNSINFLPSHYTLKPNESFSVNSHGAFSVAVIRRGVMLVFKAGIQTENEIPVCLLGPGTILGLTEFLVDSSSHYHMRALFPTHICSIPRVAIQRACREGLLSYEKLLVMGFTGICTALTRYGEVLTEQRVYDRILNLLHLLHEMPDFHGDRCPEFRLTHEEIAFLVASERETVTRALAKMQRDKVLKLGYCRIVGDSEEFSGPRSLAESWVFH